MHFRNNGSRCNCTAARIAVDERQLLHWQIDGHGVNQQIVGHYRQSFHSPAHGQPGGLQDVDLVNLEHIGSANRPANTACLDAFGEAFAFFAFENFAVMEPGNGTRRIKNDGGGEDGTEEASAADFVDTGYARKAALASLTLERAPATHGN